MAESSSILIPHAAKYEPEEVKGLKDGETKYWCRCGLSKKQPWCDGSHKGTGITPLPWKVEGGKDTYYICNCKRTKNPPFCDGSHVTAQEEDEPKQKSCDKKDGHGGDCKLCTGCGWAPDF